MSTSSAYHAVVFDLGKPFLRSFREEGCRGRHTEAKLHDLLGSQFSLPASDIASAFRAARTSLRIDPDILKLIGHARSTTSLRIYGVVNASTADLDLLHAATPPESWSCLDKRLPDLGVFDHYLRSTELEPGRTLFVSATLENVVTAMSVGIVAIHWTSHDDVVQALRHAGRMWSITSTGDELLMLDVTGDPELLRMPFFRVDGEPATAEYPPDVDVTSIACMTAGFRYSQEDEAAIMDDMLLLKNDDGIVLTYYDNERPRIDPVVCVNVLTFFHANGRIHELLETLHWVCAVLETRAYALGTLYYHGADPFLYFLSRLISLPRALPEQTNLADLFTKRVAERFGEPGDALALAMRILAAESIGLCDRRGYERLLAMQEEDGGWPTGWMYKYGMTGILIGNRGLTTSFALRAIRAFRE
ncbi:hypothetical protein C8Q77DRAFT_1215435 [Trametes polyzona]|nr:hypothetical protein C8Q77DRAFT_1215435 [Trametes polyzona]